MSREIAYNGLDRAIGLTTEEAMFVVRLQANEDAAYDELVRTYSASMFHVAYRMLGDSAEASDVVQEIFLVVHARLKTLERPASLRSWLYGVVRRTVSTYHRGRRVRSSREALDPFDNHAIAMQPSPLDLAVLSDELRLLWRLLGELDPLKRELFVLAELEEMTMPEIAEAIGIPLNTAYSRLRVARQEFEEAFARYTAQQKVGR